LLKKRLNAKQEKELDRIKKTYSKLKLIDHNEFARLWYPEVFPVANSARFYRDVSNKILQSFSDFHYAFQQLPESYKTKILTDREFYDFFREIFQVAEYVDKKQKVEPDKLLSFVLYYNFFNIGLEGLIKSMPEEFRFTLQNQIIPTIGLMQSITDFAVKANPKRKVPFVHAPEFMNQLPHISSLR